MIDAPVPAQAVVNQGVILPIFWTTEVVGFILPLENNELLTIRERVQTVFPELSL
jgi:hypothetical protein